MCYFQALKRHHMIVIFYVPSTAFIMNRLSRERRAQILGMIVEGMSLRSASHLSGGGFNTVTKLLVDVDKACTTGTTITTCANGSGATWPRWPPPIACSSRPTTWPAPAQGRHLSLPESPARSAGPRASVESTLYTESR